MTAAEPSEVEEMSLVQKIRNMWEFASVMQFIYIFGKAVKIDEDFDIEVSAGIRSDNATTLLKIDGGAN